MTIKSKGATLADNMNKYGSIGIQILVAILLGILTWNINQFDSRIASLEKWRIDHERINGARNLEISNRVTRIEANTEEILRRLDREGK